MSSRYSSNEKDWLYLNFYSQYEDFNRYQGYAIINYKRDTSRDARTSDELLIQDALRLCREEFIKAYASGTMTRWEGIKKCPAPYAPEFVVVVVDDNKFAVPQSGTIVSAKRLFSDEPISKVMESATISRGELVYEDISEAEKSKGYSPGKVIRFKHVDEHLAK